MAESYIRFEREMSGPNEVFASDGHAFPVYRPVLEEMERMGAGKWERRVRRAHGRMLEEQLRVGVSDGDRTHPTDYFPRVIPAPDWETLERGLAQRMLAINEWLRRLEAGKDEVVPEEVIESSALYDASIPTRFGGVPNRQMGFDIVAVAGEGGWEYLVIEDNAKMPVGIEPMALMRARTAEVLPESYAALGVRLLDGLMARFGEVLRSASREPDPTLAILSTGPDDQYYLDHKVFERELGAILAERHEVELDRDGYLVHKGSGRRLDVVYERIEDGRIYDDLPGLAESQASGKVQTIFAPNLGIADDKGVYPFIPEMIRTYLGEEPILRNAETFSLAVEDDYRYVMDYFDELVIKSRSGWGGKDVLIAPEESGEDVEEFRKQVGENPVEYVAQAVLEFSTHVLCETGEAEGEIVLRDSHADYRVHALAPDAGTVEVVPGAMTRVAAPGSKLVNISSGGKMKDTWVLG
ncbi:MAG TPA: circularly permuted type 2 ATP-grasp protein [Rubrobacteraceae bacterium]|nr:circularly permuted type 2 ATP-grasp protein [Rubrobacteraceae bacterium]